MKKSCISSDQEEQWIFNEIIILERIFGKSLSVEWGPQFIKISVRINEYKLIRESHKVNCSMFIECKVSEMDNRPSLGVSKLMGFSGDEEKEIIWIKNGYQ